MSRALPAALHDVAEQWYTLCERAPHATKITITGELAEAIIRAVCDTEPRAGDGDALRQAFEAAFTSGDPRIDTHNFHRGGILRVPDAYTHDRIQALWEGWQKHAAQRNEGDGG